MANVGQENMQRNRSHQPLLRRGDCETPREDSGRLRPSPRRRDAKMVRVEHRHATSQGRTIEEQDYPEGRQLPHRISDLVVPTSMGEWIRTDRNRGKAVPPVPYESKRIESQMPAPTIIKMNVKASKNTPNLAAIASLFCKFPT